MQLLAESHGSDRNPEDAIENGNVFINNGTITINGGEIKNNRANSNGGAIYLGTDNGDIAKNYNEWFCYVEVPDIPAYELNVAYTLSMNGAALGSYSALTYVKDVLTDNSADAVLVDTVTAMYRYNEAAVTYFNNHNG